jgi:hypothetical protein
MNVEMVDYTPQLTKIIQINSGKADYVEIEPRNSTHLAADNGEGKSSILNALQFLMIDDWSRMKFPKENDETASFYFPGEKSHIIFEIRDDLNHHHQVWFSGRTSAVKDRYQRIVLNGKFAKDIFINEQGNRWDALSYNEILANCSARGISFEPFKNSTDLRKYLSEKINWYPVSPDFQKRFFTVMRKLNQLSDMTPSDLKEVLIEVAQIKSTTLDFEVEYRGTWSRLEHEGKVLDELRRKQTELANLEKNLNREREVKIQLINEIKLIAKAMNAKDEGVKSETAEIIQQIEALKTELSNISQSLEEIGSTRQVNDRRIGSLEKDITRLGLIKDWISIIKEEDLVEAKKQSEAKFFDLRDRINRHKQHSESQVTVQKVKSQIIQCEVEIGDLTHKLNGMKDSIYSKFGEQGITPNPAFWTKYNPDLLMSPGEIISESELSEEVRKLNENSELILPGIRAEPTSLSRLENYTNPEILRGKLAKAEDNLIKLAQLERDILDFNKLQDEFKEAEHVMKKTYADVQKFEDWNDKGINELGQFQEDLAIIEKEQTEIDKNEQILLSQQTKQRKKSNQLKSTIETYNSDLDLCMNNWENILSKYLGANFPTERTQFSLEKLKIDIKTCKDRVQDFERVQKDVLESRVKLNQLAIYLALDPSSEEFVTRVLEKYKTIDIDEDNLTSSWMNLQGSIVQKATLLREGIVAVRRELNSINSRFKKTNVSNLELFEVKLVDNSSELKMFDSLSQLGGFAKFTRTDKEMKALETFKTEVAKRNKFYLARLFDLQFIIKNPGEELKEIKRLNFVGSGGQQTVVKTILLFLLLSKFTKSKRKITKIPVQVDEVGTLGSSNYSEILGIANALNFQIFTASPKSVAAADIVYPLLKGFREGRLFCDLTTGRPKTRTLNYEEE